MTAKLSAEEKTPLRQAWSDYLASGEYQQASHADFSAAMFQSFAYAFAAGSLRLLAQVREAEARWEDITKRLQAAVAADNLDWAADIANEMERSPMTGRTFTATEMKALAAELSRLQDGHSVRCSDRLAAMLRQGAAVQEDWKALKRSISSGYLRRDDAILSEMARLEKERTA